MGVRVRRQLGAEELQAVAGIPGAISEAMILGTGNVTSQASGEAMILGTGNASLVHIPGATGKATI